ncbi:MAG: hypothetical protein AAGJ17_00055 [Pseudomonadota bacterium]
MPDKVIDGGIWSLLGVGWLSQVDWVFLSGLLIGIATLIARALEIRAKRRENDLKERELEIRDRELNWDKQKNAINSNKTPKGKASIKKESTDNNSQDNQAEN